MPCPISQRVAAASLADAPEVTRARPADRRGASPALPIGKLCGIVYDTMAKPHVILDTNVLIAGLRSRRGATFALLELLAEDAFEISISVPLVLEYEAVARRQARELCLTHADVDAVIDFVCAQAHHRKIFYLWRPFLRDANDDMVLEVAVEAQCPFIVTFNTRDFTGVEQFGIQTLTPGQFLARLQEDA